VREVGYGLSLEGASSAEDRRVLDATNTPPTAGPVGSGTSTSSSTSAGSPKTLIIAARIGDFHRWLSGGRNRPARALRRDRRSGVLI
jgi:hypothetical protein